MHLGIFIPQSIENLSNAGAEIHLIEEQVTVAEYLGHSSRDSEIVSSYVLQVLLRLM